MAGPVRLAYRSREAGEGGTDVCARARPPSRRGRWVRSVRGRVIARPLPPAPRTSAVVDPRIGDLGPALLALEDGTVFPGRRVRGRRRCRRRPRRQHQPDRLPGGLHRPLLRRPGRGHDLSAHRQLRPARRRRPVAPAVAAGAGRRQRHGRGPRRRPPARRAAARRRRSRRSPASTRGRSPATCAPTAACAGS